MNTPKPQLPKPSNSPSPHAIQNQLIAMSTSLNTPTFTPTPILTPTNPTSITLFSSLPSELRVKIWGFAAQIPRVIPACQTRLIESDTWADRQSKATASAPTLLHVCSEAREEGLKYYVLVFGSVNSNNNEATNKTDPARGVYVNFDVDTVFLDKSLPLNRVFSSAELFRKSPSIATSMKSVAVNMTEYSKAWKYVYGLVGRFDSIEEVVFVVREHDVDSKVIYGDMEFVELEREERMEWQETNVAEFRDFCRSPPSWWGHYKNSYNRSSLQFGGKKMRIKIVGLSSGGVRI